jgi:hypothetical protein
MRSPRAHAPWALPFPSACPRVAVEVTLAGLQQQHGHVTGPWASGDRPFDAETVAATSAAQRP